MTKKSIVTVDAQTLRVHLKSQIENAAFRDRLSTQAAPARRILVLASRAKDELEGDRRTTLAVAQEVLVEAGLVTAATHVAFDPPPRKIRRPGTAAELKLHTKLRDVLHQKLVLLREPAAVESLGAGFLVLALILEGGVLSRKELTGVLTTAAQQGLRVMGELRYVNAPGQLDGGATLDSRRVHLSPLIRALLLRQTQSSLRELAADPDLALKRLGKAVGLPDLRFAAARRAMAAYCEHVLLLPIWLLSWMQHDGVYSSSLVEDCWLRANGYAGDASVDMRVKLDAAAPEEDAPEDGQADATQDAVPPLDPTEPDLNDPVFAHIGRVLREEKATPATTRAIVAQLAPTFAALGQTFPAAPALHAWLMSLHDQFPRCSTIRLNFFAVAHRLLAYCGETGLDELTQDDLELIREQLVEDGLSASTIGNVSGALNHLVRFLGRNDINTALKPVSTGIAVAHANARILLPADIQEGLEYLRSAHCKLPPKERRAAQDLLVLCYHTGMRRQEALHLQWEQVKGKGFSDICVRNTVANRLKTLSSHRNIPYPLLFLHTDKIAHALRPGDTGLVIQPTPQPPGDAIQAGSPEHRRLGEAAVAELHRIFRRLTGDDKVTLHSLRHSCATTLLLLLLARRFRLQSLTSAMPFLGEVLSTEAEEQVRELICPASYQDDGELAAVRDILGHASESMTLAHYVHALDVFRLAALQDEWLTDTAALGAAGGFSDYLCRQHPIEKLLARLERRTELTVTVFEQRDASRFRHEDDKAGSLLRQMGAVTVCRDDEESLSAQLTKAVGSSPYPDETRAMLETRRHIEPLALSLLSNKSSATSLRDVMPVLRERDEALTFCHNIACGEANLDPDEILYYRQSLCRSIRDLFANSTQIGSSVVRIPDIFVLRSLEFFCTNVMGTSARTQRFFIWDKTDPSHKRRYRRLRDVDAMLSRPDASQPTIYVKLQVPRTHRQTARPDDPTSHRNPLSTLSWVMATYYILYAASHLPDALSTLSHGAHT